MNVRKNGDHIEIIFRYDPKIIQFIKTLDGRKYYAGSKTWAIPLAGSFPAIEKLASKGFVIEPALLEAVEADKKKANEAEALAVMDDTEFISPLPLFPYQKVGAAFLYKIGSGILGDQPGVGKTLQSLALVEKVEAKKVLIFCPASVKWQWASEIERFVPKNEWRTPPSVKYPFSGDLPEYSETSDIVVIAGNKKVRTEQWLGDYRFYIANYEILLHDFNLMDYREWDVIIADEATKISNATAKTSKAIKKLRAKRRIAMTGTPISNRANEIWNLVDFCQPGAFGNYYAFLARYCMKNQWGGVFGYRNMDELREKLKRYMIRRMKVDVLPELPEKIITDVPIEMSDEEKIFYKRIKKEILFEIEATDISKLDNPMTIQYTLTKLTRLRQIADSMELLGENTKSSKLEALSSLLQEVLSNNETKAIIFTQFSAMADIICRDFSDYSPVKITGKVTGENRNKAVEAFNTDIKCRILVMTDAGAYGLNLQAASVIIHFDQPWSIAKIEQREGRAHRRGQENKVQIINLLSIKTVDYYIKKVLFSKAELSNQVTGDTPISMTDIKEMLYEDN